MMTIRNFSACALALALVGCGARTGPEAAPAGTARVHCVNPASGFGWDLPVDEAAQRVDGHPANIDARRIAWYDPSDTTSYELDRSSGELTAIRPSSLGGAIFTDHCVATR
jgi:hypothetical protein